MSSTEHLNGSPSVQKCLIKIHLRLKTTCCLLDRFKMQNNGFSAYSDWHNKMYTLNKQMNVQIHAQIHRVPTDRKVLNAGGVQMYPTLFKSCLVEAFGYYCFKNSQKLNLIACFRLWIVCFVLFAVLGFHYIFHSLVLCVTLNHYFYDSDDPVPHLLVRNFQSTTTTFVDTRNTRSYFDGLNFLRKRVKFLKCRGSATLSGDLTSISGCISRLLLLKKLKRNI